MRLMGAAGNGPFGPRRFASEVKSVFQRQVFRGQQRIEADYLEQVYREWLTLRDPSQHLSVLKYPVPEAAVDVLSSALQNKVTSAQIAKTLKSGRYRGSQKEILNWVGRLLEHPELRDGKLLGALASEFKATRVIERDRVKYLTGIPVIPEVKPGFIRMYKGTNFLKGPSISQSQVGKPLEEIKDGGTFFLDQGEANVHSVRAEAFHPDGVSVSTDKTVPINYGSHIKVFDVPESVAQRLPRGAPGLSEYVFKFSVPERFLVRTYPKVTYLEALKEASVRTSRFAQEARSASIRGGERIIEVIESRADPILIRGRKLDYSSLMSERPVSMDRISIQQHTLKGFAQIEKYSPHFEWQRIKVPPNVDLKATVHFSYAVHDVGKPLAAEFKTAHEEISSEILSQIMNKAGFSRAEVELGRALVGNDVIGKMLQGAIEPQQAFEALVEISKTTNLSPRDFFKVQSFFYSMDASSYPDLVALFVNEGGVLVPKSDRYKVLRNLFENAE